MLSNQDLQFVDLVDKGCTCLRKWLFSGGIDQLFELAPAYGIGRCVGLSKSIVELGAAFLVAHMDISSVRGGVGDSLAEKIVEDSLLLCTGILVSDRDVLAKLRRLERCVDCVSCSCQSSYPRGRQGTRCLRLP